MHQSMFLIEKDLNRFNKQQIGEMQTPKVHYTICKRGGYHLGEFLNIVCLQQTCQEQQLSCCACVEQIHKDHNMKPLRLVMLEAQQAAANISPVKFNIDIALELINSHLKSSMEYFCKNKKDFIAALQQIENSIIGFYSFLVEQVKLKNIDQKIEIQKAFQIIQTAQVNQNHYLQAVKTVTSLIGVKSDERELNEVDIISSLNQNNQDFRKSMTDSIEQIAKNIKKYQNDLQESIKVLNLWKVTSFKFSTTLKHPDINILSENVVKSINNSGYKFIIMDSPLESGSGIKKIAFRVKESSSNWVAIGVCHPKIIAGKNFGFNFSSIGHGAYMVSANGGIWSHSKLQQNNTVKSFKFSKGDIVQIHLNQADKTILFKKNLQSYQLVYDKVEKDELSPCVLFYYINDEIQYLPNYNP